MENERTLTIALNTLAATARRDRSRGLRAFRLGGRILAASHAELTAVPGIGPALARARPRPRRVARRRGEQRQAAERGITNPAIDERRTRSDCA